ncbi:probable transcription-associated protein 1 [Drosophila ficusphila]|uniref:probable transcription-associated protein 1 n=1 Tax=Drosophila ficusphila TaxID=30025 RepID=UPI0007E80D49|nr:probable transcription-associated protein 1 [Drosophila ficusphila]
MLTPCLLLVATVASLCIQTQAIRVDWGTNTGPIAPPPPRTTPQPPRKPYRDPAPVWEDQSDDIPNPNPYVYVLPPPSRPRTWAIPAGPYAPPNYNNQPPQGNNNYGQLASSSYSGGVTSVPGLAAQYVPGVGIKYTAIVVPDKLQGKYNAKTKKYKAYEKAKYAYPWNYLQQLPVEEKALEWQAELEKRLDEEQAQLQSQSSTTSTTSSTSTSSSTTTTATPPPPPSADSTTTATTAASTTTSTSTQQPTTIANYKLAHEKSAHLKKHTKQKKLYQLHLEQEKLAKKLQKEQNSLQTS